MRRNWMGRLRQGDKDVLREIYLEYQSSCLAFLKGRYQLDEEDARDVYQDAVLVLYENVTSGRLEKLESSLKTYLFGIGKNLCLKRFSANLKVVSTEDTEFLDPVEEVVDDDSEQLQQLRQLYEALGEPCKSILRMYYYEKQNMREIATKLNYQTPDVAKTQKSRCMKQLRNALKKKP